jgi:hypothetical protein
VRAQRAASAYCFSKATNSRRSKLFRLIFISFFLPVLLFACNEKQSELVSEETLRSKIAIDQVVQLGSLIGRAEGIVCVLMPYQEFVEDAAPGAMTINAYLARMNYKADEGRWALIYESSNEVAIASFARSSSLDVASWSEFPQLAGKYSVASIDHASCLPVAQAGFRKILYDERQYLILEKVD